MTQDSRLALQRFIAALERHFEAVASSRGPAEGVIENAYIELKKAFEDYEEALDVSFEVLLPFVNEDDLEEN